MTGDDVTAVVVNWRTPDLTERCVRALLGDGLPEDRLVIVDNASGDGSVEHLRAAFPRALVVANDENAGFARANNAGVRALPGRVLALVNSDAFVRRPGSLGRLLAALADPGVGIAVPRLRNEDGTLQPSVAPLSAPLPELVRASGLSRLVPNRLQPAFGTHWDHGSSRAIQAAVGAVLVVRADCWDEIGGFDERHFMYAEDLDLFRRARAAGWSARFEADAEFTHLGGASASQRWADAARGERIARAESVLLREHLGTWRGGLTVALMAAGVGGRALVFRLLGRDGDAVGQAGWFRGYRAGLRPRRQAR